MDVNKPAIINLQSSILNPAFLTLLVMTGLVAAVIAGAGGDPLALARLGTRFSQGDPQGTEGYDGQFVYYIARDPRPQAVAPLLDVPAYRYQRILLPLLGRLFSLGDETLLPWILALLGVSSQVVGTWIVSELLAGWGVSRWYALPYGLWAGLSLAVRLDLPEPLAYGLVSAAILAGERGRLRLSWLLYGLALFAKEITILFVAAQAMSLLLQRRGRETLSLLSVSVLPFALFQAWLWAVFGQPGLGSGGAMATSFELLPFLGLLRIGLYSPPYLLAMLVVFGPFIVLPSIWGVWISLKKYWSGAINVVVLALLLNAFFIAFLPFSTYREPGGLLRFASGLVLAAVLFAGRYRLPRAMNYSFLWIVLNLFLLKS